MYNQNFNYLEVGDGTRLRYGYWQPDYTVPNATTVILFQGRASFIEKFETIINGLNARGFHVWAFDWRGQGLSSRMLPEIRKGHIDSYNTYLTDIHALLQRVILPRTQGPCVVLGQSMGSHLALRYMLDHPHVFDRAILTAPLLDINTGGYSKAMARVISAWACKVGLGSTFVLGHNAINPLREPFEGNMLTRNRQAFFKHRKLQKDNPALSIGGVTYGWIDATFKSIDLLMRAEQWRTIGIPILIISAGEDVVVDNSRITEALSWLPQGRLKIYKTARHQILTETDDIMKQFWRDIDEFMPTLAIEALATEWPLTKSRFIKSSQFTRMNAIYSSGTNDFQGFDANL